MSVSSVSSNATNSLIGQWPSTAAQRKQDFGALASALQSGDLAGAQHAFSALQALQPNNTAGAGTTTTSPTSAASGATTLQNDLASLGQALSSGNLTQAQNAFAKVQSDFQTARTQGTNGAHHHHRHHHHVANAQPSSDTSSDGTTATTTTGTTGSLNLLA